jgi:hypothetical protein
VSGISEPANATLLAILREGDPKAKRNTNINKRNHMNTTAKTAAKSTHEEIAELAYELWNKASREQGRDLEFWLEAERQFQSNVQGGTKHPTAARRNAN